MRGRGCGLKFIVVDGEGHRENGGLEGRFLAVHCPPQQAAIGQEKTPGLGRFRPETDTRCWKQSAKTGFRFTLGCQLLWRPTGPAHRACIELLALQMLPGLFHSKGLARTHDPAERFFPCVHGLKIWLILSLVPT